MPDSKKTDHMLANAARALLDEITAGWHYDAVGPSHPAVAALREALGTQTTDEVLSIVDRINDGWEYVRPARPEGRKGVWFRLQDGAGNWTLPDGASEIEEAPMTDAEKAVIYGDRVRVVRAADQPSEDDDRG